MSKGNCRVLYAKYNSERKPEFRVTTEFCEDASGVFVRKRAGEEAARAHLENILKNSDCLQEYYQNIRVLSAEQTEGELRFPCIKGQTLADQIVARGFDKARFVARVNEKLATVLSIHERYFVPFEMTDQFKAMFGKVEIGDVPALNPANIDSLFTNFIENEAGIYCIDCEWVCHFPVPLAYIRYRILLYLYVNQVRSMLNGVSLEEMLGWFGFSERECAVYWQMDDRFQQHVHGEGRRYIYDEHYKKANHFIGDMEREMQAMRADVLAKTGIIHDKDVHIGSQEKTIHDMKALVEAQEGIIHDKDVHIGTQEKTIHDKDVLIANQYAQIQKLTLDFQTISNAFFWRVTKPARVIMDNLKRLVKKNEPLYLFSRTAKDGLRHGPRYALKNRRDYLQAKRKALMANAWPTDEEMGRQRKETFPKRITFSILVPLYNTPEDFLREMIGSVQNQTYTRWELCLADGSDEAHDFVGKICQTLSRKDSRIRYRKLEKNLGISGNTNACIDMARGDYIALFDHDDILHPSALYEMMKAICQQDADFVYTDEVTFESPDKNRFITVHYKPDYAPDNLLANNYICHFSAFSAQLLKEVGGFRTDYDGSQDHDMILRLTHAASKVVHIPKVLYWWRSHPQSVSQDIGAKQYAVDAAKRAVHDFLLDYQHVDTVIESTRAFPTIFQIVYPLRKQAKVSIVIPNKDHVEDLTRCIRSIIDKSTYGNYEIVVVENNSESEEIFAYYEQLKKADNIRVLRYKGEFNYSKINNWAVRQCKGEYIVLLNNDTEIITPNWLENMLMYAQRDDVGAVGAKLYFPDGRIQHAGVVIKMGNDRIAAHAYYGAPHDYIGYMGRLCYAQDFSAVTAACLMIQKRKCDEVKGLDEDFAVAYNDIDFCLKLRKKGYLNIFTPFAEVYHYESASRGYETGEKLERFKREVSYFREKWSDVLEAGDPYFNPNLSLDSPMFEPW